MKLKKSIMKNRELERIVDLTDPARNLIYNMTIEKAINILAKGDIKEVRTIDGQFALVAVNGQTVRLFRCQSSYRNGYANIP